MSRGGQGRSNIQSSSQARAQARRIALRDNPPAAKPNVSADALFNILDREATKAGRRVGFSEPGYEILREAEALDFGTRKEARAWLLTQLDRLPEARA